MIKYSINNLMSIISRIRGNSFEKMYLEIKRLNKENFSKYQEEKLKNLLIHAYSNIDYYKTIFDDIGIIKNEKVDLSKYNEIPVLTKDIIKNNQDKLISKDFKREDPPEIGALRAYKVLDLRIKAEIIKMESALTDGDSLPKIIKEIKCTYSTTIQNDLTPWAKQGVLLLNKNLIRKINTAKSCHNFDWNHIPLKLINQHSKDYSNIVYLLLGKHAHVFEDCIYKNNNHKILKYSYPTTDKGENIFTYSRCFLHINEYLKKVNKQEIIW